MDSYFLSWPRAALPLSDTVQVMDAQLEIRIRTPVLRDIDVLDRVVDHAATVIYRDHPRGGPALSGDAGAGEISLVVSVDGVDADAWLPQARALIAAALADPGRG